jgi:hypothetical protein
VLSSPFRSTELSAAPHLQCVPCIADARAQDLVCDGHHVPPQRGGCAESPRHRCDREVAHCRLSFCSRKRSTRLGCGSAEAEPRHDHRRRQRRRRTVVKVLLWRGDNLTQLRNLRQPVRVCTTEPATNTSHRTRSEARQHALPPSAAQRGTAFDGTSASTASASASAASSPDHCKSRSVHPFRSDASKMLHAASLGGCCMAARCFIAWTLHGPPVIL